jgi:short-subunit dehydrogenase
MSSGMIDLRGANALVTGAGGAIGRRTAELLADEGANVALCDVDEEPLRPIAGDLENRGVKAAALECDLLDDGELADLPGRAEEAIGAPDVLVASAGIEFNRRFDRAGVEELDGQLGIHLRSPMLLIHRLLPEMLSRGRGHIVVVSSLNGKLPFPGKVPYAAGKAGSIAMIHALRRDFAGAPVGFSVVLPAIVEGEGQAARAMDEAGVEPPKIAGTVTPAECAEGILEAIRKGRPEVTVSARPSVLLTAMQWAAPRLADRVLDRTGLTGFWREIARAEG